MTGVVSISKLILIETARDHGVTVDDLVGQRRFKKIAYARFDAMARLRAVRWTDGRHRFSTVQIGKILGDRDHTTVVSGLRRWEELNSQ